MSIRILTRSTARVTLAAAVAFSPLSVVDAQDPERHVLTGDRVQIWNLAGRTTIESTTGNDVIVEVTRGGSDQRDLRIRAEDGEFAVLYPDRTIVYGSSRSTYSTELRVDRNGRFGNDAGAFSVRIRSSGPGLDAHADLRILIPKGKRVEVNVAVGEMESSGTEGNLALYGRASTIRLSRHKGPLEVQSGSGSIRVDHVEGDATISTGSGTIDLQDMSGTSLRASSGSGRLEAREVTTERFVGTTGSGGVRLEAMTANDVRVNTGSGGMRIDLRNTPHDIAARAGSGSVEITLPADTNLEVDVSTGSGGITSDFPVTMESFRRRELRGKIGNGEGGYLRVGTGSGSVRILKR